MAKTKRIPRIAFIGETEYSYNQKLLLGLAKYAQINGPWAIYIVKEGPDLPQRLKELGADALILRDAEHNMPLLSMNLPTILIAGYYKPGDEHPTIDNDSKAIGKIAAEYYIDRGYSNFAYAGYHCQNDLFWSKEIGDSFTATVEKHGLSVNAFQITDKKIPRSWESEHPYLVKWLKDLPKPVAMMTCNDPKAAYIIQACKEYKIAVPEEIAIIGVNNEPTQCCICTPPLSSVVVNTEKAGFDAGGVLDDLLNNRKPRTMLIRIETMHVLTRQSSDMTAIDNPSVALALQFIRENGKYPIQVNDVVAATTVCRRVLERYFKKHLNCTILDRIRRTRIDLINRALVETDMSIKEIAKIFGFNDTIALSHYYHNATGTSMSKYRTKHKVHQTPIY